jgi:5-methylcytosine-specific restriction endonuclease McrA
MKKIIILSEEEKKRIEAKINERARKHATFLETKRKRICPACGKTFDRNVARRNHHTGRCSVECNPGGVPIRRLSKSERKAARKAKELRRKQNRRKENRAKLSSPADFYETREWRELRYKVLRKFGFKCMACGSGTEKGPLHVDHIKPRSYFPELELEFENLQVLCGDCNIGKSNHFSDDLRPKL